MQQYAASLAGTILAQHEAKGTAITLSESERKTLQIAHNP